MFTGTYASVPDPSWNRNKIQSWNKAPDYTNTNEAEAEAEVEVNEAEAKEDDEDIYDLSKYTDAMIISEILDLDNPSSNVLEAKIVGLIRRYRRDMHPEAEQFYIDVYARLFDVEQAEDGSLRVREPPKRDIEQLTGASSSATNPAQGTIQEGTNQERTNQEGTRSQETQAIPAQTNKIVSNVKVSDYAKGKLNPLMKETMHKLFNVDSQHRASTYPYSTDFTMNLGEVLKNVVKLHLYSITIPYHWYTISRAYGSNFFVIRGTSPGINNGNHDITVQIMPGTYTPTELVAAISTSLTDVRAAYSDMDFGDTGITYNALSATASISLALKYTYSTAFFRARFSPALAAYLGFTQSTPYSLSSARSRTVSDPNDTTRLTLTDSNNVLTVLQYRPLDTSAAFLAANGAPRYVAETTISGTTVPGSPVLDTVTFVIPPRNYTQASLALAVDAAIKANPDVDSSLSGLTYDPVARAFVLSLRLNRFTTTNTPYSALVALFPSDPVWTGPSGLNFGPGPVELNYTLADTQLSSSNIVVVDDTYILYHCKATAVTIPDAKAVVAPFALGYSQNAYIDAIQDGIDACGFGENNAAQIDPVTSRFTFSVNINRVFDSSNYTVTSSPGQYMYSTLGITTLSGDLIGDGQAFYGNFEYISANGYIVDEDSPLCTISRSALGATSGVADNSYVVVLQSGNYTLAELQFAIETAFRDVVDTDDQQIFQNTTLTFTRTPGSNRVDAALLVTVNRVVTENEYTVGFYVNDAQSPSNQWSLNLFLEPSYDLFTVPTIDGDFKQIVGDSPIVTDVLSLQEDAFIYLEPDGQVDGVAGSVAPIITVPRGMYTRQTLFSKINEQLANNGQTLGSRIAYVVDNLLNEYAEFRWTVNKTYTTTDYSLVFYDTDRFVSCFIGNSSTRNVRSDETMGWILGYRTLKEYALTPESTMGADGATYYGDTNSRYIYNATTGTATLWGDSSVNVNIYNSFYVILNDYNQNRLNDNLVTIAAPDYQLSLPSYASRYATTCDPTTNREQSIGIGAGAQLSLTKNQIYAASQIIDAQNARTTAANQPGGVYLTDVFAAVPLKLGSIAFGQNHTELSGTLQNQDRLYFGPVNINRLTVKLVNDRGDPVDLNGQNWSMQISCEYLYENV